MESSSKGYATLLQMKCPTKDSATRRSRSPSQSNDDNNEAENTLRRDSDEETLPYTPGMPSLFRSSSMLSWSAMSEIHMALSSQYSTLPQIQRPSRDWIARGSNLNASPQIGLDISSLGNSHEAGKAPETISEIRREARALEVIRDRAARAREAISDREARYLEAISDRKARALGALEMIRGERVRATTGETA